MKFEFRNFKFSLKTPWIRLPYVLLQSDQSTDNSIYEFICPKTVKWSQKKNKKKKIALDLVIPEERENSSHNSYL